MIEVEKSISLYAVDGEMVDKWQAVDGKLWLLGGKWQVET